MPIFHLTAQWLGRRAGRSAVAAAAYRAGVRLVDQRTGQAHDFTRRRGVLWSSIYTPTNTPDWAGDRQALWSAAELSEVRCNARTAREIEVALPVELTSPQRLQLAQRLARELSEKHKVAVDLALHAPGRGDARNFHAHLLFTTRELGESGLGKKTREWDDRKAGPALITWWRARWAELVNTALELAGRPESERVDHRSLAAQGVDDRSPQIHLGPHAAAVERRTGRPSRRRQAGESHAKEIAAARDAHAALRGARAAAQDELAAELLATEVAPRLADIAARNRAASTRKTPPNPILKKGKDHGDYSPQ